MAKKTDPKELRLDALELSLLQRNVLARELRDVKVSMLDTQVANFDAELRARVTQRLGLDLRDVSINAKTGEIIKDPVKKVG